MDIDAERDADLRVLDEQIVRIRNRLAVADDDEAGPLQDRLLRFFQRRARMLGLDRKEPPKPKVAPPGSIAEVTKRLELVKKKH